MKKIIAVALIALLVFSLAACGKKVDEKTKELVGKWESTEEFFEEVYEFKSNGEGSNENAIFSYDFKFEVKDGKLNIYQKIFGMYSDEPMTYDYSIDGDVLTLVDEYDVTYEYVKIS
ncbi:MAG: hypothetical protein GX222_00730 [Ruminococcaceae bacterium]|nr:hypothetical protein [Oscillospiraceae bacterium]